MVYFNTASTCPVRVYRATRATRGFDGTAADGAVAVKCRAGSRRIMCQ